jgi:LmbE family N-acetylglucosaminyl deacetylase
VVLADEEIKQVLVVVAHPDDVDFAASGTVASFTDRGVPVSYCLATDGDAGGFDPAVPRSAIGGIRRREQTEAAAQVGVTDLHWLGHPDGMLEANLTLRRDIARVIRKVKPDVVITQSPERNYQSVYGGHPDHRAAGGACLDAVYPDARNPFTFPELARDGLDAWTVREVWIMAGPTSAPEHAVDVTDAYDRKLAGLMRHRSQFANGTGHLDELLKTWLGTVAKGAGLPDGRLAEGFSVMPTA